MIFIIVQVHHASLYVLRIYINEENQNALLEPHNYTDKILKFTERIFMGKRGRKRRSRRKNGANHGKRPNA